MYFLTGHNSKVGHYYRPGTLVFLAKEAVKLHYRLGMEVRIQRPDGTFLNQRSRHLPLPK